MFEYIKGKIVELKPANVVLEANAIGWFINTSLTTYTHLSGKEEAQLFIHQIIREDAHTLYGFAVPDERVLFRLLISVNGIGANTAIMMLSALSPEEIRSAILGENVVLLKSIKGIGEKTAQRIIIDLKDKIGKGEASEQIFATQSNTIKNEALSALIMLGFSKKDVEKAVDHIISNENASSVEEIVKAALKRL